MTDKLGEHYSVLDAGAVGDGATDNAAAFAQAVSAAAAAGGGEVFLPKGTYVLNSPVAISAAVSNLAFVGDGAATVIKRGASLPAGKGLFDVAGANIQFRHFVVDGGVTTPAGLQYGTFSDPMDARLTGNTSFWIHGGAQKIRFTDVTVQHTGGYAVLLDATSGADIADVRILDCTFENNRPHLFGSAAGDLNYGSWTGGIHYQGDGANYAVRNLLVRHCTFRRNTGNCVWGHAYAFNKLHSNIEVSGCYFEDCGLDGVETAAVSGGVIEANRFRRIGYICTDDTSASVPKFLSGYWACALDTSGLVRGVNYQGNTFISVNGGCMDLDGFGQGTVSGNTCIIPSPGEPEYTEDSIATFGNGNTGANWVYGCQPSNSNNVALPGTDITVSGNTFINMGGGAIKMFAARNCTVQGNNIIHPATANYPPIALGNIGTGPYQQATGNVVTGNQISWSPSGIGPAIFEDASEAAFAAGCKNWVAGNRLQGNCLEFQKDPNSASSTGVVVSSGASSLAVRSENIVQREGLGNTAVYRIYQNTASGMVAFCSLFDVLSNSGGAAVGGPLFNVSNNGAAGTGSFSTAGRTTAVFDDAVLTGKVYGDSFLALTDATYVAAQANLLPASMGLLRYNSATGQFLQSVSVASGARVWAPLVSAAAAGSNQQVQYNASGSFAGSAAFTWNSTAQLLTVTAANSGSAGIACATGYVQSDAGFYATVGTATSYQAIQAPGGGLYGRSLRAIAYTQVGSNSGAPSLTAGDAFQPGALYFDTGASGFKYYTGSAWSNLVSAASTPGGSSTQVQYNSSGAFAGAAALTWNNSAQLLTVTAASANSAGIACATGYIQSDAGFYATAAAATSYQSIQAPSGGLYGRSLRATAYTQVGSNLGAPSLTAGDAFQAGALYYDTGATAFKCYTGSGWTNLLSAGGSNTQVQFNASGAFAGSAAFAWNNSAQLLTVTAASASSAGIACATGFVQSDAGFYATAATATSFQSIQAPGGGLYGRSLRAIAYSQIGNSAGAPAVTAGDAFQAGALYYDTGAAEFKYFTGSAWNNLVPAAATPGGTNTQVQYNASGAFAGSTAFTWNSGSQLLTVVAPSTSVAGILCSTGYIQSDAGFYATAGTATSFQAIQAPGGGLYGRSLRAIAYSQIGNSAGAPAATAGDSFQAGALYYDTGAAGFRYFTGSAWGNLVPAAATPGGGNAQIQFNASGAFAGSAAFTWNTGSQLLTVVAASNSVAGILCSTGYIQSDAGFYATAATATSFQSIQAPGGGLYGRSLRAIAYTQIGNNYGLPSLTTGDAYQLGAMYYDTSVGAFKGYTGSGWLTLLSGSLVSTLNGYSGALTLSSGTGISVSGLTISNTGVTAVYAGTGISVNANTGGLTVTNTGVTSLGGYTGACSLGAGTGVSISGLTISIGQAVGTGSAVTFYSLVTSAGMQINQNGGYGLYLPSSYVYANGLNSFNSAWNGIQSSGGVSASSGFYMSNGTQVINSSGVFVGPSGINVGSAGISCGAYAINGGYYGATFTFQDLAGTTHSVKGGILLY